MQCSAFFQLKGKSNSQSGWRTVQTNLGFFFQDLNQKLKFPTTMSTDLQIVHPIWFGAIVIRKSFIPFGLEQL